MVVQHSIVEGFGHRPEIAKQVTQFLMNNLETLIKCSVDYDYCNDIDKESGQQKVEIFAQRSETRSAMVAKRPKTVRTLSIPRISYMVVDIFTSHCSVPGNVPCPVTISIA